MKSEIIREVVFIILRVTLKKLNDKTNYAVLLIIKHKNLSAQR